VQRVVLSSRRRAASLLGRVPGGRRHEGASADQSRTTFCNAPSVSLYLDQMGDVRACCQNAEYPLGNITRQSLREIWDGQRTGDLRRALEQDDLTLGCQFCRWQMAEENENLVYARTFDHLRIPDEGPTWPQQLELSLSNACNLQCIMCNGDWSSSIRTHREGRPPLPTVYDDAFFDDLAAFLPHLRIVKLLGGEPFLGKESLRVLDMLVDAGLTPEVHVTTNGTQWSPRVERIMERLPMEIIVSLDGCDAETYESIRVGSDFAVVMENLDRFQEYARRHGTGVHLAHCLMTTNWHRFADFLRFADARDLPVGVNTVTSPIELSLHHLHPDRLDEIVAELDGMNERVLADLGRNAPVWSDQLERLHHRQRALAEFEDVSYYLGRGTILGVPWRRRPEGRDHQAEAVVELERLAGVARGPVLVVDDAEQVVSVEAFEGSTELAGVDLVRLIGRHAAELFSVFDELHGAGTPEMLGDDLDLQHWRIVFDGPTGLVVDAVIAAVVDHAGVAEQARIHLAFRQTAAAPDAVPVRSEVEQDDAAAPVDLAAWFAATVAGDVHELVVDGDGVVCSVGPDPTDVVGVDLSGLVGASVMDLIAAFEPVFGALADRWELELPQGADARARVERVTFDGPDGATSELRVLMEPAIAPDGRSGLRVRLGAPQPDERPG
jgi:radical SAM protein with 4Fe4S-binding SPASM domain